MTPLQLIQMAGAAFTLGKDAYDIYEAHKASGKGDNDPLSPEHSAAVSAALTAAQAKILALTTHDSAEGFQELMRE